MVPAGCEQPPIARPEEAEIDAFTKRHPGLERHIAGERPQFRVIGVEHVGPPRLERGNGTCEWIAPHEVDVVSNEHERGWAEIARDPPGGIRHEEEADPKRCEDSYRQGNRARVMPFIHVKSSALQYDGHTLQLARYQLTAVSDDGRRWKARNL